MIVHEIDGERIDVASGGLQDDHALIGHFAPFLDAEDVAQRHQRNALVAYARDAGSAYRFDLHAVVLAAHDLLDRGARNGVVVPPAADSVGGNDRERPGNAKSESHPLPQLALYIDHTSEPFHITS